MKNGAYIVHLRKYKSIGTHWTALYANVNNVTKPDIFGVEHIPE